jgi:translocation and assembly module TamB
VRLRLGDEISFEGFSLRGLLRGDLLVQQAPGRDPVGNGKLGIVDGVYSGLGADLEIERGWVNFASSPLDDPGLDVRAVRRQTEMEAGVQVSGTAREPKVAFFSRPSRPESEIVAYLLFGRPLGATSTSSSEDRKKMQDAAALAGGGMVAAEIGRTLGIADFGVEGSENGPALTVGRYVTPQLYLQYLSGIRSTVNRLRMRYDLTRRIQIQAETGDGQAADIFYTFER